MSDQHDVRPSVPVHTVEIDHTVVAEGLKFPEGPVAMPDGTVLLVEIARATLSRVDPASGEVDVVAECGGGPNGAAIGPDGRCYVTNNGGYFSWLTDEASGITIPGPGTGQHTGGSIQAVDLATGQVEVLYDSVEGERLIAPNDLVLDEHGTIWFTDHGAQGDLAGRPGLLAARPDGSSITAQSRELEAANGVGLSPTGERVYVAETHHGCLVEWRVAEPGVVDPASRRQLFQAGEGQLFDSLAVDGEGWICVATIGNGGVTAVAPDGARAELVPSGDPLTTNVCFSDEGGSDAELRTAYLTCSSTGRLIRLRWPRRGLALAF